MGYLAPFLITLKTGERLTIRTAHIDDSEGILELTGAVIGEDLYHITVSEEYHPSQEQGRDRVFWALDNPTSLMLVAEVEDTVFVNMVGVLTFTGNSPKRLAHHGSFGISVHRGWRGKGIGTALVQGLVGWAELNPLIEKVCLDVFHTNTSAISLYKKLGFVEEGRKVKHIKFADGEYSDLVSMYKLV